MPLAASVEMDAATQALLMNGEDYAEFHAAFTEKRPPKWRGNRGGAAGSAMPASGPRGRQRGSPSGRRTRRALRRRPPEAAGPRPRDHRMGAQRPRRHLRLRRGPLRRDARRHRARRSRRVPGAQRRVRPLGHHRHRAPGRHPDLGRPRLRRAGPPYAPADPARALRVPRGTALLPDRGAAGRRARARHDLVIAADGVHSATREAHARHFRPTVTTTATATSGSPPTSRSTPSASRSPRPSTA